MNKKSNSGVTVDPIDIWYSRTDDMYYGICPECETSVHEDMQTCPLCGAHLDWSGDE